MMKRLTACAMAALLILLAAVPALAETYTLEEKFYMQAFEQSAYRGTVTFAVSGNGTALMDSAQWALLRNLAPRLSLSLEHTTTRERDEGQATVSLLLDGKDNIKTTLLYDEKLYGVSSTLLGGENAYFTVARDWDLSNLAQSLIQQNSAWPPVWRMILAALNAPEAWKERAKPRLSLYETKLGLWMNSYASFSTGRENNVAYSELSCTIPAQAVKAEIKQLLLDLYNDAELLSMLREIVTAQEAAAYLQPVGMNNLFAMLDQLKLEEDVQIVRRYDATGNALLDSMTLPFAGTSPLHRITVSVGTEETGKNWRFQGEMSTGAEFDVSCLLGEDHIYTGAVTVLLPEEEQNGFVVKDSDARRTVAFDYSLIWEPGEDQYNLSRDQFSRAIKASLLIRPREGSTLPEQSVVLDASLLSGSSQRSATQLNGTLTWRDMESDASITATLSSRTVSPFAYNTPSSLNGAVRLDLLTQESRSGLMQSWLTRAAGVLGQLLLSGGGLNLSTVQPR